MNILMELGQARCVGLYIQRDFDNTKHLYMHMCILITVKGNGTVTM